MSTRLLLAFALSLSASAASAQWVYGEDSDAMTDEKYARTFVKGEKGSLGVKCDKPGSDSLYIHFISAEYLGAVRNDFRTILVRFDSDPPTSLRWFHDGRSAILTDDTQVVAFLNRLSSAKKVALRATDFNGSFVDASFDVAGAATAIEQVRATCRA